MDLGALMGMLGQGGGQGLDPARLTEVAQQIGIPPGLAGQALQHMTAAAQSGQAQTPGQAVEHASQATGVDAGQLAAMLQQVMAGAGAGGLMGMAAGMLDRDKDGSVLDDLAGMAGGFSKR